MTQGYLERYLNGEHEQVWQELVDLGPAVREEPLYAEARAVAAEMMRRARHNVDLIVRRLRELGFRFAFEHIPPLSFDPLAHMRRTFDKAPELTERMVHEIQMLGGKLTRPDEGTAPDLERAIAEVLTRYVQHFASVGQHTILEPMTRPMATVLAQHYRERARERQSVESAIWCQPDPPLRAKLMQVEEQYGPLPITMRAWFEIVGEVCLMGDHPTLSQFDNHDHGAISDPLVIGLDEHVYPVDSDSDDKEVEAARKAGAQELYDLELAPDVHCKSNYSGGGSISIRIPNASFDGPLDLTGKWDDRHLIPYLRRCFAWGGFPGLAHNPDATRARQELAFLTRDLLPI